MGTNHRGQTVGGPFLNFRNSLKNFMERERAAAQLERERDRAADAADRQRQQSRDCGCKGGMCLCGAGN